MGLDFLFFSLNSSFLPPEFFAVDTYACVLTHRDEVADDVGRHHRAMRGPAGWAQCFHVYVHFNDSGAPAREVTAANKLNVELSRLSRCGVQTIYCSDRSDRHGERLQLFAEHKVRIIFFQQKLFSLPPYLTQFCTERLEETTNQLIQMFYSA
jgi:hypothetical protein